MPSDNALCLGFYIWALHIGPHQPKIKITLDPVDEQLPLTHHPKVRNLSLISSDISQINQEISNPLFSTFIILFCTKKSASNLIEFIKLYLNLRPNI